MNYIIAGAPMYQCPKGLATNCIYTPLLKPLSGLNKIIWDLNNSMRMLWEQHVAWTRMAIISIVFDLPDEEYSVGRLLRNPKDFQAALRSIFGEAAASRLGDLLAKHLLIAAELVKAAKAGNNEAAADAEKRWYANADEIASFLAEINPNWSQAEWMSMLHEHLRLTKDEAVAILTGDYASSVSLYDEIELQALQMADLMTRGISLLYTFQRY